MTWVGLDLHKRCITACALDDAGEVVAEHRRPPADDTTLLGWLAGLPRPVTVAMKATPYWTWLHERLTAAGHAAVAAHPYQVKLIWPARCKTDLIDARKLADLGEPIADQRWTWVHRRAAECCTTHTSTAFSEHVATAGQAPEVIATFLATRLRGMAT